VPSRREPLPGGWLDAEAAATVLRHAGVPVTASRVCSDPVEASQAAEALGFPAVVKVVHPGIVHKSEHGGVRTGLLRPEEVREAAAALLALAPGARVLVQRQRTGVELLVGGVRDQEFGPTVAVGLGGVLAEVLDDVAFALAPLGEDEARRLLRRLRCYPRLAGFRGSQPVDVGALARTVSAVGDLLVEAHEVAEVDLNPVLAGTEGCEAVDWRVLVRHSSGHDERRTASSPCGSDETPRPVA
jgi:acetyltransferase